MDSAKTQSAMEMRIYDEATNLFYKYGYHGTTLRMLSEVVGVKTPSIYYHVGNKQMLLFAIMSRTLEEIHAAVEAAIAAETDPVSRLRIAIQTHIKLHTHDQKRVFVADSEVRALEDPYRDKVIAIRDAYQDMYKQLIAECLEQPGAAKRNVRLSSYAVLSMCTGVAQWYRSGGQYSLDFIATEYADFILKGLGLSGISA